MFTPDNECVGNSGEVWEEVGVREALSCRDLFLECLCVRGGRTGGGVGGETDREVDSMSKCCMSPRHVQMDSSQSRGCCSVTFTAGHTRYYATLCVQMRPPGGFEGYVCSTTGYRALHLLHVEKQCFLEMKKINSTVK